jgi:RNA polymerase sigma factor (sigma-70 family)
MTADILRPGEYAESLHQNPREYGFPEDFGGDGTVSAVDAGPDIELDTASPGTAVPAEALEDNPVTMTEHATRHDDDSTDSFDPEDVDEVPASLSAVSRTPEVATPKPAAVIPAEPATAVHAKEKADPPKTIDLNNPHSTSELAAVTPRVDETHEAPPHLEKPAEPARVDPRARDAGTTAVMAATSTGGSRSSSPAARGGLSAETDKQPNDVQAAGGGKQPPGQPPSPPHESGDGEDDPERNLSPIQQALHERLEKQVDVRIARLRQELASQGIPGNRPVTELALPGDEPPVETAEDAVDDYADPVDVPEPSFERREPTIEDFKLAGALQAIVQEIDAGGRDFKLTHVQREALQAMGENIVNGEVAGVLEVFTGGGKSLCIALYAEAAVRAGQRIHIITDSISNANQLIGENGERGMGRFTNLVKTGLVKANYGGRIGNKKAPVIVSTWAGLLTEAEAITTGKDRLGQFDQIAGDECQRALGRQTVRALYGYQPGARRVGFSATPDFAEDRQSAEAFSRTWYRFDVLQAIKAGRFPAVRALLMPTDVPLEVIDPGREFTPRELEPLVLNGARNGIALLAAQGFFNMGLKRGNVACIAGQGNLHASIMARLFSTLTVDGRKVVAMDVGSHLSKAEDARRRQLFDAGEVDILTDTVALEVGWDPKLPLGFIMNLQPTRSERVTGQRMGRFGHAFIPEEERDETSDQLDLPVVYVDFADTVMGPKQQYTALHALKQDTVDYSRIVGEGNAPRASRDPMHRNTRLNIEAYLSRELLDRLMQVQGKPLSDVLVNRQPRTREAELVDVWERKLLAEGLPAEVPFNQVVTPRLDRRIQTAIARLEREGVPITLAAVHELATESSHADRRLLQLFGVQLPLEAASDEIPTYTRHGEQIRTQRRAIDTIQRAVEIVPEEQGTDPVEKVEHEAAAAALEQAIEKLSERDAVIIRLRFGLSGHKLSHGEVAKIIGKSEQEVRRIERDALAKAESGSIAERKEAQLYPIKDHGIELSDEDDEVRVLSLLNGRGGYALTQPQVGRLFNVTRSWISVKEELAIQKLRHPALARKLVGFTDTNYFVTLPQEEQPTRRNFQNVPNRTTAIFAEMPKVPVYDSQDPRPYILRLREASYDAGNQLIKDKERELRYATVGQLQYNRMIILRQLEETQATRRRLAARPIQSPDSRAATILALDVRELTLAKLSEMVARKINGVPEPPAGTNA